MATVATQEVDKCGFLLSGLVSSSTFCCYNSCGGRTSNLYVKGLASFMVLGKEKRKAGEKEDFSFWHSSRDVEGKTAFLVFQKYNGISDFSFPDKKLPLPHRSYRGSQESPEQASQLMLSLCSLSPPTQEEWVPGAPCCWASRPSLLGEAVSPDSGKNCS